MLVAVMVVVAVWISVIIAVLMNGYICFVIRIICLHVCRYCFSTFPICTRLFYKDISLRKTCIVVLPWDILTMIVVVVVVAIVVRLSFVGSLILTLVWWMLICSGMLWNIRSRGSNIFISCFRNRIIFWMRRMGFSLIYLFLSGRDGLHIYVVVVIVLLSKKLCLSVYRRERNLQS